MESLKSIGLQNMRPKMRCLSGDCAQEFEDEQELRRHFAAHAEAIIAAARALRKIHLPVETWTDVLLGCGPLSLGERICFSRRLFHEIARPLLDGSKGRFLSSMAFLKSDQGNSAILVKFTFASPYQPMVELPIAEVPPPQTVAGFSYIQLNYFDAKVLSFLSVIRSSLLNDICLELKDKCSSFEHKLAKADRHRQYTWKDGTIGYNVATLCCLLRVFPRLGRALSSLCIRPQDINLMTVELFTRLVTHVRHLMIYGESPMPEPETLALADAYSRNCSPYIPVVAQWLHTPLEDGQQKTAGFSISHMENLVALIMLAKEHFLSSTADSIPVPYFVVFHSAAIRNARTVELPFRTLRNERTREVLTLRHYSTPLVANSCMQNDCKAMCYLYNLVLYRRSCASSSEFQSEKAELEAIRKTFERTLSLNTSRNKLVLNVADLGEIDKSLFTADSEEGTEGGNESGPSCEKRIKLDNGE